MDTHSFLGTMVAIGDDASLHGVFGHISELVAGARVDSVLYGVCDYSHQSVHLCWHQ